MRAIVKQSMHSAQYADVQPVQKKRPACELTIPVAQEVLFRYEKLGQFPGAIARGLRIPRMSVDRVIMQTRRVA